MANATNQSPIEKRWVYSAQVVTRWSDMDAFSHVNNSVYLTYFEEARVQWWHSLKFQMRNLKTGPIIAAAQCNFLRPILNPGLLRVELYLTPGRRTSYTIHYEIKDTAATILYAEGSTVVVWLDYETGKPIELPEEIKKIIF
jgi:acyl-CoA thioester hydrolase